VVDERHEGEADVLGTLESALPVNPERPSSQVEVTTMETRFGPLLQWSPHGPHHPTGPHGPMGPGGWIGTGWTMPWGAGGVGPGPFWALVALLLVVGIVALGLYLTGRLGGANAPDSDARRVLAVRYARGEIDDDEYERRRTRLDDGSSSS
jgi:putative membrane protein